MKTQKFFIVIALAFLLVPYYAFSQKLSGTVKSADGTPIVGATVLLENTNNGVVTDLDGKFSLNPPDNKKGNLIFSYIGFITQKIAIAELKDLSLIEVVLKEDNFGLTGVVVTARKREEDIRSVPLSISTLSAKELGRKTSTSAVDILNTIPNVNVVESQYTSAVNIRGIQGGNSYNPGSGTAEGTYLNGVYMGPDEFQNNFVTDLQRLEILRGPQGTEFGRNSISGAVNMTTIKPTDENYASINMDYGQRGFLRIRPTANVRVAKNLYVRASYLRYDYDGFIKNTCLNQNSDSKVNAGRVDLRYIPKNNFFVDLSFDFTDEKYNEQRPNVVKWANAPGTQIPLDMALAPLGINLNDQGRGTFNHNTPTTYDKKLWGTSLNLTYNIGKKAVLTSITSLRDATRDWSRDLDFSEANGYSEARNDHGKQFSEELRISSTGSGRLTWVAGAFYYNLQSTFDQKIKIGSLIDTLYGVPAGTLAGSAIAPRADLGESSLGLFASSDYQLTDFLTLNAGLRYTYDKKDMSFQQDGVPGVFPAFPDANGDFKADGYINETYTQGVVTPSISLEAKAAKWANVYALYSNGYKAGGFNVRFVSSEAQVTTPFKAERMNNFELGTKMSNSSNKLFANLAVFMMKYHDMQVAVTLPDNQGIAINNAASADVKGLEFDLKAIITNNIALSGGMGLNNSEYSDYTFYLPDGTPEDRTGEKLANIPQFNSNVALDLSYPIGKKMKIVANLQYTYHSKSEQPNYVDASGANTLDAVGLINGRLGFEAKNLSISLWGRNLANTEYLVARTTSGISPFILTMEQIGEPRLLGVNFAYSIGWKKGKSTK